MIIFEYAISEAAKNIYLHLAVSPIVTYLEFSFIPTEFDDSVFVEFELSEKSWYIT